MNRDQAKNLAGEAKGKAQELYIPSRAMEEKLRQIVTTLNSIKGSGIAPNMLPTAIALANEAQTKQEEQSARMFSLIQGIQRIIGN